MSDFGIDFGTTNTSAVEIAGTLTRQYGDEQGEPLPSVVILNQATGEITLGRTAWNRRSELTEAGGYHVIGSVKRCLESNRHWLTSNRRWEPRDIAAEVLKQLSRRVQAFGVTGGIARATFSVPVGFSAPARRTLREAAALAGIEVSSFVAESTAAFINHYRALRNSRHVAVFDWGGGTLDISVLEIRGTTVHELATGGCAEAGDAIDLEISLLVHRRVMAQRGADMSFDEVSSKHRDQLSISAERAKRELGEQPQARINLFEYAGATVDITLTRDEVGAVLAPYVERALDLLASTVKSARLAVSTIDDIIVIGGSSELWLLHQRLASDPRFGGQYRRSPSPKWDVAKGAAMLEQHPGEFELAETLGVQLCDGTHFPLVRRGDRLNTSRRSVSLSLVEDASEANIVIDRWSESSQAATNALHFAVPTLGFLQDEIRLSYEVTRDLTVTVSAESHSRGPEFAVRREFSELRFGYHLGEQHGQ